MSIIDDIKDDLKDLVQGATPVCPSSISDPLAQQTSWKPAKGGGSNFGTHRLKQTSYNRWEFRIRGMAAFFPAIFLLVGLGTLIGAGIQYLKSGNSQTLLMMGIFGLSFTAAGFFMLLSWLKPRVFDPKTGYYWKGFRTPGYNGKKLPRECYPLSEIKAIQLIKERCTSSSSKGRSSSYYSYELNLVFGNGERCNVIDHGNRNHIEEDGETLSEALRIPLWKGI